MGTPENQLLLGIVFLMGGVLSISAGVRAKRKFLYILLSAISFIAGILILTPQILRFLKI